ncbi:HAD-IIIA family hydrolase [Phenylobacterium montanum]|uniref:D,D-heptose 1,7-bisphosphate phosphatase n=1 Tax=Phenylobacterium montanum TaxID=2823693 RepID=A0A975FVF5_9CAUL|nr:HAD-IIIA family hydrolase [Caulobacter sp. S6]QUD86035.1 HAD-IIIA family hydrolase [Caulobacter sp. S6]
MTPKGPAPSQCVILVGGLGTRLGDRLAGLPKPLVPVGGKPFLDYLLWHARRFGFSRVLLLAGHRSEAIVNFIESLPEDPDFQVELVVEPQPMGTGGALRFAADRLDERFVLLNGDSVFDFNWLDLVSVAARNPDAAAVLSLRRVDDASRFGVVDLDGEVIRGFRERGDAGGGLINGGVYLLDRSVAEGAPEKGSFEAEVLPALAARGKVAGRPQQGFFLDIGIPDALDAAQALVPGSLGRPAIFFDRDGVLNIDHGYVHKPEDFEWTPGAIAAVKAANDRGLFAFLVTNQAGVARGYYDEAAVRALHAHVQQTLRAHGAHLDDIRHCPHHPEGAVEAYAKACDWRKPGAGMILDLAARWPVDLGRSQLIGDNPTDIQAAEAAGIGSRLYQGGDLLDALAPLLDRACGAP